uniref:Uncharacterized protein n=2 Tax=Micrurus TaxID=8634 RepID=A0A2D4P6Y3_MICSU
MLEMQTTTRHILPHVVDLQKSKGILVTDPDVVRKNGWTFRIQTRTILLGITTEGYNKGSIYLILHILTAARMVYAQQWKSENTSSEREIIKKILVCAELDRLNVRTKKQRGDRIL